MSMMRWDPFSEMMSLRQAMDRLLEESFIRPGRAAVPAGPAVVPMDIIETDNDYIVKAFIPGVRPEDVDVSVTGDLLTIKGELKPPKEEEKATYLLREVPSGTFSRTITLPTPVDASKAKAQCENGMCILTLPKAEGAKPKRIQLQPGQKPQTTQYQ